MFRKAKYKCFTKIVLVKERHLHRTCKKNYKCFIELLALKLAFFSELFVDRITTT